MKKPGKPHKHRLPGLFDLVGVTGLEPMASWSRTKRSTKLSYTPKNDLKPMFWEHTDGITPPFPITRFIRLDSIAYRSLKCKIKVSFSMS